VAEIHKPMQHKALAFRKANTQTPKLRRLKRAVETGFAFHIAEAPTCEARSEATRAPIAVSRSISPPKSGSASIVAVGARRAASPGLLNAHSTAAPFLSVNNRSPPTSRHFHAMLGWEDIAASTHFRRPARVRLPYPVSGRGPLYHKPKCRVTASVFALSARVCTTRPSSGRSSWFSCASCLHDPPSLVCRVPSLAPKCRNKLAFLVDPPRPLKKQITDRDQYLQSREGPGNAPSPEEIKIHREPGSREKCMDTPLLGRPLVYQPTPFHAFRARTKFVVGAACARGKSRAKIARA